MSEDERLQLQSWLHDMEEGSLSEGDHAQLEALLLRSETARQFAVQRLGMSAALCRFADEAQEASSGDQEAEKIVLFTPAAPVRRGWPMSARLALAASFILSACVLTLVWQRPTKAPVVAGQTEVKDQGCAVLVDAANAQWAEGAPSWQVGMAVPAGKFALTRGLVRLEFYSGASVTLEGRSELDIVSVKEARCRFGQMRVHVPPHARGFRLITPDADVVDMGTEFGLKVNEGGQSEVHVFDGEVEVFPGSGTDKLSLKQGAMWNASGGATLENANSGAFADLASMRAHSRTDAEHRMKTWRKGMKSYLTDPRLLVGYTFEPENEWERTLSNQRPQAGEATNGSIVGARWSQGRWQGKRSLEFKSPGDRVRLVVAGEYHAITLAAWVQLGGIDRRFNSLFLTDTWAPGNPHWQFVQDGSFVLGVHALEKGRPQYAANSPKMFGPETLGSWFHLATTFDLRNGVEKHYVNGVLVTEHQEPKIDAKARIIIGSGELGNWGLPEGTSPRTEVRSFNGRMDEFLLFGDVLEAREIARIYDLGRPN